MEIAPDSPFHPLEVALVGVDVDPSLLDDQGVQRSLAELERLTTRLRCWQARLIGEACRRRFDRRDGSASPAAWLSTQLRISSGEAGRRLQEARAVADPLVGRALEEGAITPEHARTIAATVALEPGMSIAQLVDHASTTDAGRFARRASRLRQAHQVDRGLSHHEAQRTARHCSIRVRPDDGMVVLHAELDPLAGAKVQAALLNEADRLWRAEHPDPRRPVPRRGRTSTQRLADALANIFGRPPTPGLAPESAEVLVTLPHDDLVARTGAQAEVVGVGPIPAATARRLACEAGIIPVVLGGRSEVLDLGRRRRLATTAQRRALRHLHPTCAVERCETPFDWCQVHHLQPWTAGGRTDLDQLVPLCTTHHHLAHEGGWSLHRREDRTIVLAPPPPEGIERPSGPIGADGGCGPGGPATSEGRPLVQPLGSER